jgi:hypothetical protein
MYIANKNLEHNRKEIKKGDEVKQSDAGFKDLLAAGHLDQVGEIAKSMPVEVSAPIEAEVKEEPKKKKSK